MTPALPLPDSYLSVSAHHPWWGVSLLIQYSQCSVGSLSMADMLHGSFFNLFDIIM